MVIIRLKISIVFFTGECLGVVLNHAPELFGEANVAWVIHLASNRHIDYLTESACRDHDGFGGRGDIAFLAVHGLVLLVIGLFYFHGFGRQRYDNYLYIQYKV